MDCQKQTISVIKPNIVNVVPQTVAIHRDYLIAGDVAEEAALMERGLTDIQVKQQQRT